MSERCPFAEVKGFFKRKVYCLVVEKEVDFKEFGCLSTNYKSCPFYTGEAFERREGRAVSEENSRESETVLVPRHGPNEEESELGSESELERMVNEHVKKSIEKFKNPLKGEIPNTCYDCVFFSPTTKRCVLLRRVVENPEEPPCKEKFGKAS